MGRVVIIGNGGHARASVDAWPTNGEHELVGYSGPAEADVLGLRFLGTYEALPTLVAEGITGAFVAIGSNSLRQSVSEQCQIAGLHLVAAIAPSARVGTTARVGSGSIVMHGAVLGANVAVGVGSIINTGATVDHDCVIGDFVHIAPGANLAGTVTVGDGAMVGIGASVIPGIRIGAGATVGAGAAVVSDVPDGQTVVGVPARPLER